VRYVWGKVAYDSKDQIWCVQPPNVCYTGLWEFPALQACCVDPWLVVAIVLGPASLCLAPALHAAPCVMLSDDVLPLHSRHWLVVETKQSWRTDAMVPLVRHKAPVDILCVTYTSGRSSMPVICQEKHAGHAEHMLVCKDQWSGITWSKYLQSALILPIVAAEGQQAPGIGHSLYSQALAHYSTSGLCLTDRGPCQWVVCLVRGG